MHTVLSAFRREQDASRAVEALLAEGYPRQNVHVQQRATVAPSQAIERVDAESEMAAGARPKSPFSSFMDRLLGREHQHESVGGSEAVEDHTTLVVLDTSSETAAERAVTIMRELGACEIAER